MFTSRIASFVVLGLIANLMAEADRSWAQETAPPAPAPAEPFDPIKQKIADDWDKLLGTWESRRTINGQQLRFEKQIREQRETLRVYDAADKVLREQTADLKLEIQGNLHVLKWSNAKVTAGAGLGTAIGDGTAVYTFKDGQWISVCGLAEGEPWAVYTETWSRPVVEEEDPQ
jgi:hypothetical protein